jgi:aspartate aminotransferase
MSIIKAPVSIIADHLALVKPSPTIAVNTLASELTRAGQSIISLGAGEPDFDTPDPIKESAILAIQQGKTKYTPTAGIPELRDAICRKFKRENGIDYEINEVMVSCGGKQVLYNALSATLNPQEEVIIPAPFWPTHYDIPVLCRGVPVVIPCSKDLNYKISPEQLDKAITPATKWFILNSPSNPSGAAYSASELNELADVLLKDDNKHVLILSDDIYEHIVYDNFKFTTLVAVAPQLKERTLILNGLSKAYSMTGWRVGYCAGPKNLIKAMTKIQSQSTTSTSTISQWAGITALDGEQQFIHDRNATFKARRDKIVNTLNGIPGISCSTPQGAFYVYPSCAGLIGHSTPNGKVLANDSDVATYFLEEASVAVVPGVAFGLEPHFRISYAISQDLLDKACNAIEQACLKLT